MYLGFEKDVFKTIADYYGHLKEPLLTFHLFDAFVSVLGGYKQCICMLIPNRPVVTVSRVPVELRTLSFIFKKIPILNLIFIFYFCLIFNIYMNYL